MKNKVWYPPRKVVVIIVVFIVMAIVVVLLWWRKRSLPVSGRRQLLAKVEKEYYSLDDYDGSSEREFGVRKLIRLACMLYHGGEPIDVDVSVQDRGSDALGVYTFCYPADHPELAPYSGPDWCCYWWKNAQVPNFLLTAKSLEEVGRTEPTTGKAGWVGNIYSPLGDVPEFKTRPLLQTLAKKNPSLLEVFHVSPRDGQVHAKVENYMTLEDQVRRYRYLIDIGGNGYSGRLKMILWSGRPILLVKRRYIEYFFGDLVPYRHYIPVEEDLRDLVAKIEWCNSHPAEASLIGRNALQFAREHFDLEKILHQVFLTAVACRSYRQHLTHSGTI